MDHLVLTKDGQIWVTYLPVVGGVTLETAEEQAKQICGEGKEAVVVKVISRHSPVFDPR